MTVIVNNKHSSVKIIEAGQRKHTFKFDTLEISESAMAVFRKQTRLLFFACSVHAQAAENFDEFSYEDLMKLTDYNDGLDDYFSTQLFDKSKGLR